MPNHIFGADMGEGYGIWKLGDEEGLIAHVDLAHIACGFHGADFMIMDEMTQLAKSKGIKIGAHPSLPDRQGFGRREMAMTPEEFKNCILYQVGALSAFLKLHGVEMNHIKPHGSAYGMCARDPALAKAVMEVCKLYNVAFVGMAGTEHDKAAKAAGVTFIGEYYGDRDYTPEGKLVIGRHAPPRTVEQVREITTRALTERKITTTDGSLIPLVDMEQICVCIHSDTPDAVNLAIAVREVVNQVNKSG